MAPVNGIKKRLKLRWNQVIRDTIRHQQYAITRLAQLKLETASIPGIRLGQGQGLITEALALIGQHPESASASCQQQSIANLPGNSPATGVHARPQAGRFI
ncbi:hypothetical protein CSC34_3922 [Pseudomonas aeruginosa]|nr:hypothetical protein CSC34_3922 [Pseudomonas aeruginosa]